MASSVATYGIYPSMSALHGGAEALAAEGFRQTDISVLYSDRCAMKPFAHDSQGAVLETAAAEPFVGGILGYLAGIGALTFPGVGPLLAAGPLAGVFRGMAATGSQRGLIGALMRLGLPEPDAKRYEGCVKDGGILLSVSCDDAEWAGRAKDILTQTGATHLSAAAEKEAAYQL